jgi:cobaltochelatase CobS
VEDAIRLMMQALGAMQSKSLDADAVRAIVQPMIDNINQPKVLQFQVPPRPDSEHIDNAHKLLPQAVTFAQILGLCWLCGPAGSGKTTIAEQVAKAMSLPFGSLSCTAGMSEGHLTGRPTIQGGYIPARFVELYETGGVFLFDEFDAADPNTALVVNSALANGYLSVPYRTEKQRADRHKNFVCIIATNTWGNGADPQYLGRSGLDLATRDRFAAAKILVQYDQELEKRILGNDPIHAQFMRIRDNIAKHNIRRILSTRAIAQMSMLIRAGLKPREALESYLTDWTDPERAKGLENVRLAA